MFVLSPISKNINSFIIILCSSINLFDEQNGILFWVWQNGKLTFPAFEWHHFDPRRCVFRFDINKEDKINGGLVLSVFVCVFKMGHVCWLLHWKKSVLKLTTWKRRQVVRVEGDNKGPVINWELVTTKREFLIFSKFKSSSSTVAGPLFLLGQATTRKADTVNKVLARGEWIVSAYFSSQQD